MSIFTDIKRSRGMCLFDGRVRLFCPPRCDIIVFDEAKYYMMTKILQDLPHFIYGVRPEKIYISPRIIWACLKSFRLLDSCDLIVRNSRIRTVLAKIRWCYRLGLFTCINPKIIITFVDNNSIFHWLCKNYQNAEFFAIQNGNRLVNEMSGGNKHFHKNLFCFGNYEKDLYDRFGHHVERYYPVGSLLGGYYKYRRQEENIEIYDICVVSTLSRGRRLNVKSWGFWESFDLMNEFVARYSNEYGLRVAVLLYTPNGEDLIRPDYSGEKCYFRKLFGSDVELIERDTENFTTYRARDRSHIVIGQATTAVREAFGWGKKVLYCDFTGTNRFCNYDQMIMFTDLNYELFKKRLNELRAEPNEAYEKRTKEYASYLMNYDPECPPHIYIREKIAEYLCDI